MRDWPEIVEPRYERAVFLDRDGTINVDTHYPHTIDELEFYPGSLEALRVLGDLPVHVLVVSNQAGIALGRFTREEMSRFNEELRYRIEQAGGRIDAFYFCPHDERKGLPPDEESCNCSKPGPGMLLEAARDFDVDLERSVMIGDKSSDIVAGKEAGCATILVRTGKAGQERGETYTTPDLVMPDLGVAARHLERDLAVRSVSRP